tara:strand:+ start:8 stop:1414 length:1407 start_codon:yes stop_codon:yes gene_type:complete
MNPSKKLINNTCNWKPSPFPPGQTSCKYNANGLTSNWKTINSIPIIVPTNSRPLPQPHRSPFLINTLPDIFPPSVDCTIDDSSLCDLLTTNGGNLDPYTGQIVGEYNYNSINLNDYLAYNNSSSNCSPGWTTNRVFGNYYKYTQTYRQGSQTSNIKNNESYNNFCEDFSLNITQRFTKNAGKYRALPRPIKHWRKQLFPRQYVNQETGKAIDNLNNLNNYTGNNVSRGRSSLSISMFERPGGYSLSSIDSIKNSNNSQVSCASLFIKFDISNNLIDSCNQLNTQESKFNNYQDNIVNSICKKALRNARPGYKYETSQYFYHNSKGYLQGRVKLSYQTSTFFFNLTNTNFPNTYSLYNNNQPIKIGNPDLSLNLTCYDCYNTNPKLNNLQCKIPITYKPKNKIFQKNSAVSSGNNIRRKAKSTLTRNQYNITNSWGIISKQDSLEITKVNNRKMGNKYKCGILSSCPKT